MKKVLIPFIMLLLITNCFGNSVFSFYGFPISEFNIDSYGFGLGKSGTSDLFRVNGSLENPAVSVVTDKLMFNSAVTFGYTTYKDESNEKFKDTNLTFPHFNAILPIKNHRIGFDFTSLSSGNIKVNKQVTGDFNYESVEWVESSLYRAGLFYALKNNFINFGAGIDAYLGNRTYHSDKFFDPDEHDHYFDTRYETRRRLKEFGLKVGLSKKYKNISLGLTYYSPVEFDIDRELVFEISSVDSDNTVEELSDEKFTYPQKISLGITTRFAQVYKATFESHFENWKSSQLISTDVEKSIRLSGGLSYDPIWGFGNWYQQFPFRIGGYYRNLPFKSKNGKSIIEKGLTAGISIPLASSHRYLDFAVDYGKRGDVIENLYEDNYIMFTIGTSGFDIVRSRKRLTDHRDIPKADL